MFLTRSKRKLGNNIITWEVTKDPLIVEKNDSNEYWYANEYKIIGIWYETCTIK